MRLEWNGGMVRNGGFTVGGDDIGGLPKSNRFYGFLVSYKYIKTTSPPSSHDGCGLAQGQVNCAAFAFMAVPVL